MITINTTSFGELEVAEDKVWRFEDGLPGLEEYTRFVLVEPDADYPLAWLQSVDEPEMCLAVTNTFRALPDYAFDLSDEDAAALGVDADAPGSLAVYSVIVLSADAASMTANLAAPVLVNVAAGKGRQAILSTKDYQVRFPIFEALCRVASERLKEEAA